MHACILCEKSICNGELYYDGGFDRRAHVSCVEHEDSVNGVSYAEMIESIRNEIFLCRLDKEETVASTHDREYNAELEGHIRVYEAILKVLTSCAEERE